MQLGFAEADITPTKPMNLIGFYREDSLSKGVLSPLMVQVAVWKSEEILRIAYEAKSLCGIEDTGWLKKVADLNAAGIREQTEDVEMQYFNIADWCMCGGPYEFMVGFALESEKILKNEFFYLNGYTNGCLLYFPTEDELEAGGYEVYWSMLIYYIYIDRVYPFRKGEASKLIHFCAYTKY